MESRRSEVQLDYLRMALATNFEYFDEELHQLCSSYSKRHAASYSSLEIAKSKLEMNRDEFRLMPFRQRLAYILENPLITKPGKALTLFQAILVLGSVVSFVLETVPAYNPDVHESNNVYFFTVESVLTVYFTIETLLRFFVTYNKLKWVKNFANQMDILSVLPYYLELIWPDSGFLVVFRIVRLTRVIKLLRNLDAINNLIQALKRSARALIAPIVFLIFCVLVLSSIVYYAERGDFESKSGLFMVEDCDCTSSAAYLLNKTSCPKIPSRFTSIPTTMWWGVVTMTTVGYGDLVPQCQAGKFFAVMCMILGILFVSMPIAIVGSYFTVVIGEQTAQRKHIKELIALNHKQDRKRVEALARNRQLAALETGEMRAFCSGRKLKHSGTRDDMMEQIYLYLGIKPETDPGVQLRQVGPGEALIEYLRTFVDDHVNLADFGPVLVHHLDVFLYRLMDGVREKLNKASSSATSKNMSVCPCRLHMTQPVEVTNNTLLLSKPLMLSVGRPSPDFPDPDLVLPVYNYPESTFSSISQRHATITVECTPTAWVTTLRPITPNRITVNGTLLVNENEGIVLKQGDIINFCPTGTAMEFRYECDDFDMSSVQNALVTAQSTYMAGRVLPPVGMAPKEAEIQQQQQRSPNRAASRAMPPPPTLSLLPEVHVSAFPEQLPAVPLSHHNQQPQQHQPFYSWNDTQRSAPISQIGVSSVNKSLFGMKRAVDPVGIVTSSTSSYSPRPSSTVVSVANPYTPEDRRSSLVPLTSQWSPT